MHTAEATAPPHEHLAQFYETEAFLLETVTEFIRPAFADDGIAIVLATPEHLARIGERFAALGLDPHGSAATGRYIALDAEAMLERITVNGEPDADRYAAVVKPFISQVAATGRRLRVYGEMAPLLAMRGNRPGALLLETLWNMLRQEYGFASLCAYPIDRYGGRGGEEWLGALCREHTRVIPGESYSTLPTEAARLETVVALQQKALRLETEITERLSVEERLIAALAAEQAARHEAQATKRLHDELLTDTAHDFRNPLTTLVLNVQLTLRHLERDRDVDPARIERALRAIADQAVRMSELLDRLLDVPHIDAPPAGSADAAGPDGSLESE